MTLDKYSMEMARMDEDTDLKSAAPQGVGGSIPSVSAKKNL